MTRPGPSSASGAHEPTLDRALTLTVAMLTAGAGIVHMAMVPMHTDHRVAMTLFLAGGLAQLIAAAYLVAMPRALVLRAVVAINAGAVLLWALTRSAGIPFLPGFETRQAIEAADVVATGFELAALCAAVVALRLPAPARGAKLVRYPGAGGLSAIGAASVLLLAAGLTVPSDHSHHSHGGTPHAHGSNVHPHEHSEEHGHHDHHHELMHEHRGGSNDHDHPAGSQGGEHHTRVAGHDHEHAAEHSHAPAAAHDHGHTHAGGDHENPGGHGEHAHGTQEPEHSHDDHDHTGGTKDDPHNIRGTCDAAHPYVSNLVSTLRQVITTRVPDMAAALQNAYVPLGPVPNDFGYPDTYWHWVDWMNPPPGTGRDEIVRPDEPQYLLLVPAYMYPHQGRQQPQGQAYYEELTKGWVVEGVMFAKAEPGRGPELYPGCNPFHTHSAEAGGFSGSLNEHFHVWPWHHIHPFAMNPPHLCTDDGQPVSSPYPFRDSWGCMS